MDDRSAAFVITGFQSDDAAVVGKAVRRLERLINEARAVRTPGSPALSLSYVACGRSDAFCHGSIESWDVAAGVLLVQEAGGKVTDYEDRDLDTANATTILASNGRIHSQISLILAEALK